MASFFSGEQVWNPYEPILISFQWFGFFMYMMTIRGFFKDIKEILGIDAWTGEVSLDFNTKISIGVLFNNIDSFKRFGSELLTSLRNRRITLLAFVIIITYWILFFITRIPSYSIYGLFNPLIWIYHIGTVFLWSYVLVCSL